jgi:hypothetical protein
MTLSDKQDFLPLDKNNIPLVKALALSVAIHEKYGFQSKSATDHTSVTSDKTSNLDGNGNPITNSARLYRQLFPSQKVSPDDREIIDINDYHYSKAENILNLLKGFGFIAIDRPLTSFEKTVLDIVNRSTITHKELGRVASFPNVYERKISQEIWEERESELSRTSEYVGELHDRTEFQISIENVRYLSRTQSYLICGSESNCNIVKFFISEQKLNNIKQGDNIKVSCWIKKHDVSNYHGGKETLINRVKFL